MGRAGRSGQRSISVLFYTAAELKGLTDSNLRSLCDNKENCRRRTLLKALGSSESVTTESGICCDICEPVCPYEELDCPKLSAEPRKNTLRKRTLPTVSRQLLETELVAQREALIERNPALKMFPKSVICPITVIREVCNRSRSVKTVDDLKSIACLRQELHVPFFNVIVSLGSGVNNKRTCS